MAKKKCKKRRVRRKARKSKKCKSRRRKKCARKGRKRKGRKGRKGRRRNPGNFVKPTVSKAQAHLKHWSKQKVTSSVDILAGMKAPYVGLLDDMDKTRIARIRFNEAKQIVDAYDTACEKIKATRKVTGVFKCPISTKSVAKYIGTGGNFRPVTKKRAEAYLKRLFRWSPKLQPIGKHTISGLENAFRQSAIGWLKAAGRRGDISPRLEEAMVIVGADRAEKLLTQAQKAAVKYAAKEAAKAATKAAAKAKRDEKTLAKIQKDKVAAQARLDKAMAKLNAKEAKLTQATAVASRKAKARRSKRSRRRNPVRRRKAKRSMKRRAKKSKRRRKAKRSMKRKSRRKSRRRR